MGVCALGGRQRAVCVRVRACVVTRVDGTCVCARVRVGARVRSHQHGLAEVGWHDRHEVG